MCQMLCWTRSKLKIKIPERFQLYLKANHFFHHLRHHQLNNKDCRTSILLPLLFTLNNRPYIWCKNGVSVAVVHSFIFHNYQINKNPFISQPDLKQTQQGSTDSAREEEAKLDFFLVYLGSGFFILSLPYGS